VKTEIFPLSIKLVLEHVASFLPRVQDNTTCRATVDKSAWLTEQLDGGTFLMDVWKIQRLSWYFA